MTLFASSLQIKTTMKSTRQASPKSTPKKITYSGTFKPSTPMASGRVTPITKTAVKIYPGAKCC
jgi:hypothetical protein